MGVRSVYTNSYSAFETRKISSSTKQKTAAQPINKATLGNQDKVQISQAAQLMNRKNYPPQAATPISTQQAKNTGQAKLEQAPLELEKTVIKPEEKVKTAPLSQERFKNTDA
jgi:hypothetical protein